MHNLRVHDFAAGVATGVENEKQGPVVVVGHAWGSIAVSQLAVDLLAELTLSN